MARPARGLTLVELMVAIAIGSMLMLSAAPFFADYTSNSRLRESGNVLFAEALGAQGEAVKRGTTVRLSTTGAAIQLLDLTDPAAPVLLRERALPAGIGLQTATLDFGNEGRPVPFGASGSIDVSMSGVTCSATQRCPGLRVDAGGAMRLCANRLAGCT